ncbi:GlxA family transcriptional regulator [Planctobacterium marinum]|uniref:HTH araC/xylS-type domain-containing protein n=1 Tax=Planctobacterium marinum TaxID=1631968 RepID=A0AA48HML7_9ALTE|nr:hypothetical protein MACH26_01550 [Planctobacterium marinum]
MKTINIIATPNCVISSLTGIVDFMEFCNIFWRYLHPDCEDKLFHCQIYTTQGSEIKSDTGISIKARNISEYEPGDAVFLVSIFAHNRTHMEAYLNSCDCISAVIKQEHQQGKVIASYCTGTFGLARTGVLDGAPATTVWWMKNLFTEHFPEVKLKMDELVVEHQNLITGGATTSYFSVCMAMLEKMTNDIFATQMSKLLLLDKQRLSQQPFIDTAFIINKHDAVVERVQAWMMSHYAEPFSLDAICEQFAVSKRTLIRRFKNACGETPLNYLQKIRIEKAKHYLESTNLPVEQIVLKVGYEDVASFRKLFTSHTQLSPKNYRERFSYNMPRAV